MERRRLLLDVFVETPVYVFYELIYGYYTDVEMNKTVYDRLEAVATSTGNRIIDYASLDFGFSIDGEEPTYLEYHSLGGVDIFTKTHNSYSDYYVLESKGSISLLD